MLEIQMTHIVNLFRSLASMLQFERAARLNKALIIFVVQFFFIIILNYFIIDGQ